MREDLTNPWISPDLAGVAGRLSGAALGHLQLQVHAGAHGGDLQQQGGGQVAVAAQEQSQVG